MSFDDTKLESIVASVTRHEYETVENWLLSQDHRDYLQTFFKNTKKIIAMDQALAVIGKKASVATSRTIFFK